MAARSVEPLLVELRKAYPHIDWAADFYETFEIDGKVIPFRRWVVSGMFGGYQGVSILPEELVGIPPLAIGNKIAYSLGKAVVTYGFKEMPVRPDGVVTIILEELDGQTRA